MSERKRTHFAKWMLTGALLLPMTGHDRSPPPRLPPPAPHVNAASIPAPADIQDPQGYKRLVAARMTLDASIDLFATEGVDRLQEIIGLSEFTKGGTVTLFPPHHDLKGQCSLESNGKRHDLPELLYMLDATAEVMRAQAAYNPCPAALKASPGLAAPYTFDTVKQRVMARVKEKHASAQSALSDILDQVIGGPMTDYCAFSPPEKDGGTDRKFTDRLGKRSTTMEIPAGNYYVYSLTGKQWNGTFRITVENPRFQEPQPPQANNVMKR